MSTVGGYLMKRLEQAGVKHVFGVPGDYVLRLFDYIEESPLTLVNTCNELNGGYAADAYSRINGIGAVCVTYGVGGFSMLNAAVGASAERLPLVVISGAPAYREKPGAHLMHHTIGDLNLQYRIYEEITVASVVLRSCQQAPKQIDDTLEACLRFKRPVYIEIPMNMVDKPCAEPGPFRPDTRIPSNPETLDEASDEAVEMLGKADNPLILAGIEAHRLGIKDKLLKLINHSGYHFSTTLLGKAVLPEIHPGFIGVYSGAAGKPEVKKIVENAGVLLKLGTLMTDINFGTAAARLNQSNMIAANSDSVKIKHHIYPHVSLEDFIDALIGKLPEGRLRNIGIPHPSEFLEKKYEPVPGRKITIKRFFRRINECIDPKNVVISDTGDSILSLANIYLREEVDFIGQAFYLSIGYATPATLGAKLAAPEKRPVAFVGDGAFQMTCQEFSTIVRFGLNPVIFLMNNDGYTIERYIRDGSYNDIPKWNYSRISEALGAAPGITVRTEDELENAIAKAYEMHDKPVFIEVVLDKWDCSESLQNLGRALRNPSS